MPRGTWQDSTSTDVVTALSAKTTSSATPILPVGDSSLLRAQLEVTAVSGTAPTLDVVLEDTLDGTNWNVIGTFAQVTTAPVRSVINVSAPFTNRVRARWTIGGTTPSITFMLTVYAQ